MNYSNFAQTEGYPLTGERLQELQTSFQILNSLGNIAGNLTILSGCRTEGATVQNGVLFIDGEPIEFRAAAVTPTSTVIIIEQPVNKPFYNGTVKTVHTIRYATFGTAATSWPWSEFKRPEQTKNIPADLDARLTLVEKKLAIFQAGGVVFPWRRPLSEIPDGFQEVTDLRGKTVFGHKAGDPYFGTLGNFGGASTKTLAIPELPPHYHHKPGSPFKSFASGSGDYGNGSSTGNSTDNGDNTQMAIGNLGANYNALGDALERTVGEGQSFSILNPYRVVHFIEFVA